MFVFLFPTFAQCKVLDLEEIMDNFGGSVNGTFV